MGLLDRLAPRKHEPDVRPQGGPFVPADPGFPTKALRKFLACLTAREQPVVVDLGPVVGGNVTFLGEQLGCKIFVEDIFADLDRHARDGKIDAFASLLKNRLTQKTGTVDGILCWDLIDYLDRPSAQQLASELTRVLRPDGALLGFFGTAKPDDSCYTKFVIVDDVTLKHRSYPAARRRQMVLVNRDILRLFAGLRVSDSFLLQNNQREILFRKPL
jgi:hypothetical protein